MTEELTWRGGKILNPDFFLTDTGGNLQLRGGRCALCGKVFFPHKVVCTVCFEKSTEAVPLSGRGRLVSWSVAGQLSLLGLKSPYCFGYIDLEEGPRIYGLIEIDGDNFDLLYKGIELQMKIEFLCKNQFDQDIYTYKFIPANTEQAGG